MIIFAFMKIVLEDDCAFRLALLYLHFFTEFIMKKPASMSTKFFAAWNRYIFKHFPSLLQPFMMNNNINQSTSFKRLMYSVLGEAELWRKSENYTPLLHTYARVAFFACEYICSKIKRKKKWWKRSINTRRKIHTNVFYK